MSLDASDLQHLDMLVRRGIGTSRIQLIQTQIQTKLARLKRLARECEKLDPAEERAEAESWQGALCGHWGA